MSRTKRRFMHRTRRRIAVQGRRLPFLLALLAAAAITQGISDAQNPGKPAAFRLNDAAGKTHALADYAGRILVLEFWSFKCPVALTYGDRMAELNSRYGSRGISFLAVASNRNESALEVRRNAENLKVPFPVLLDTEGDLAYRLGATDTPGIVILDGAGNVRYRGAIDNNKRPGERDRIPYVEQALDALLAGRPVPTPETAAFGCGIRR